MDSDKQKQILGYFIEEASDHLNNIEASLVNIQETLADPEMMNELFRSAHSIKGGAAMLGITTMQYVAHSLEDSFKVLKDYPNSKVDQDLQSLLLSGFDALKELLVQVQNPAEFSERNAQEFLTNSEPMFLRLKNRISELIPVAPTVSGKSADEIKAMTMVFRLDVPAQLRSMLQLFKEDDRPSSRSKLQAICDQLVQMGEQFDQDSWCNLIQIVKAAIANSFNSYRILAPIIIREIKQAQESVLKQTAISPSSSLKALISKVIIKSEDEASPIFGEILPATRMLNYQKFGDRLQWRVDGEWISSAKINFSSSAPSGHLPAPIWLSGWNQNQSELEDQNRKNAEFCDQVHKLMTKISQIAT